MILKYYIYSEKKYNIVYLNKLGSLINNLALKLKIKVYYY